jgi:hypothetical protein
LALTELRLLCNFFGIESIIKQPPDVVLSVGDASRAQLGLHGAPGTLRVIDEKTVYFRPPKTYLEPEALLTTLRNLLRFAYDSQIKDEPPPAPEKPAPRPARVY